MAIGSIQNQKVPAFIAVPVASFSNSLSHCMKPFSCRSLRSKIEMMQRKEAASRNLLWAKIHSKQMSRELVKSVSGQYVVLAVLAVLTKHACKQIYMQKTIQKMLQTTQCAQRCIWRTRIRNTKLEHTWCRK